MFKLWKQIMWREGVPTDERLGALLDEWQPEPHLGGIDSTSEDFARRLHQRIAEVNAGRRPAPRWSGDVQAWTLPLRWAGGAMAAATLVLLVLLHFEGLRPTPPAPTSSKLVAAAVRVQPAAVVQDLQALNQDQDLINDLDFLSLQNSGTED